MPSAHDPSPSPVQMVLKEALTGIIKYSIQTFNTATSLHKLRKALNKMEE